MKKKRFIRLLLDILYPPRCMFCKSLIDSDEEEFVCSKCIPDLPYTKNGGCFETFGGAEYLISPLIYEKNVRRAIRELKFESKYDNAKVFAKIIAAYLRHNKEALSADYIVCVPLSGKSLLHRGFNQTYLISRALSEMLQIPVLDDALLKIRETKRQSSLSDFTERANNVIDAYDCKISLDKKMILLVDDVYTSGMTIYQCAKTLKKAGAKKVIAVTAATAHKDKGESLHNYKGSRILFPKRPIKSAPHQLL